MSDPGSSSNVSEPTTVVGAISRLSDKLLNTLPPAFLLLVALNVAFLGTVLWFLSSQMAMRTAVVAKIIDACMVTDHRPPQ